MSDDGRKELVTAFQDALAKGRELRADAPAMRLTIEIRESGPHFALANESFTMKQIVGWDELLASRHPTLLMLGAISVCYAAISKAGRSK
jgi:hypothetical protein